MRAITGGVVSSEPCSLDKAARTLLWFSKSAASHLPSSDCDTYLRTVTDATVQLIYFREELGGRHQQGAANFDAHDYEDPVEGDRRHQDQESEGDMAVAAYDLASSKKKGKKKKNENPPEDRAVARADSHIPPSPEIATEKRKKKKHPNKGIIVDVKQERSFVVEEELVSEKKKSKKKKEKDHVKLEEDVNDVEEKIVNDSAAEQRVARTERERKKKKHEQEEGRTEVVKEEKRIADGDLDIEKKRKKKRGRGDVYDNAPEQVEHTKKKQKKHSGD
ncbi:unnamed protein product [Miscanthus lutarioriparius]|uniref:Uncharacterized protein n=1 Tax=Miscanthus lutarioriparius TaxID=422564 RepID=A0A811P2D1_9POAL|nr:unnamed protein product [Miscanthus lutarioriparius]